MLLKNSILKTPHQKNCQAAGTLPARSLCPLHSPFNLPVPGLIRRHPTDSEEAFGEVAKAGINRQDNEKNFQPLFRDVLGSAWSDHGADKYSHQFHSDEAPADHGSSHHVIENTGDH